MSLGHLKLWPTFSAGQTCPFQLMIERFLVAERERERALRSSGAEMIDVRSAAVEPLTANGPNPHTFEIREACCVENGL